MLKEKLIIILVLCLHLFNVRGQSSSDGSIKFNVIPPSPNPAALAKYVDFPVSQASGVPQISLPLGSIGDKELSIPISLSYHAGGARVEEFASWVGLGWTLSGGGVITRTVRGLPDDVSDGNHLGFNYMKQKMSDHQNHVYDSNTDRAFMKWCADGLYDTEPDQYFFNFQGKSGKIIFDADGNGMVVPYQNLRIQKSLDGFTIIDESGIKYGFGALEYTEAMDACDTYPIPAFVSSWHLTSITMPSGKSISFSYQPGLTFQNVNPVENKYESMACPNTMSGSGGCLRVYKITTCRLTNISIGKSTVNLIATTLRTDLTSSSNEMRLEGIEFKYENKLINKYLFDYGAFGCNKLKLNQVKEYNPLTASYAPLYVFDYLYPESVPCITSKAQDHWGFFNANAMGTLVPPGKTYSYNSVNLYPGADRSPNFSKTQAGVLNKITYQTGGYRKFDYELNSYGFINKTKVQEWEQTTSQVSVTATPTNQTDEQDFIVDYDQVIQLNYKINIKEDIGEYPSINEYIALINNADNSTVRMLAGGSGTLGLSLPAGSYKLVAYSENPFTLTGASLTCDVRTNIPILNKAAGGLRIAEITDHDGSGGGPDLVRTFKYVMSDEPTRSSGVIAGEPIYESRFTSWSNGVGCSYYVRSAAPLSLGSAQGGYVGYREVVVEESNGSSSLSKFTTFYDYPDPSTALLTIVPVANTFDYLRGLLLKKTDYKKMASLKVPVHEVSNHYTIDVNNVKKINGFTVTYLEKGYGYVPDSFNEYLFEHQTEWFYQDSSKVVSYDMNGQNPVTTFKAFKYENSVHAQNTRIETTKSNGLKETELTTYPLDYASGTTFIDDMNTAHIVNYPIEKIKYTTNTSGDIKIIGGSITKYKTGGKGLKDEDKAIETAAPVVLSAFKLSNRASSGILPPIGTAGVFSADPLYKSKLKVNLYDAKSNILEYQAVDGIKVSLIWDYDSSMPIAQVINSAQNDIAYTSFEAEGKGNWTFSGTAIVSGTAATGNLVYQLSSGALSKSGLTNGRTYILSYRTKNTVPFMVAGTVGTATSVPLSGGWTLYEHQITGTATVQLAGTGIIDEVRLYPSDASITTYTYAPMVGTTSQTDAKGQTTYYEYDEFQRLKNVKDQNGNILKNNIYHYKP